MYIQNKNIWISFISNPHPVFDTLILLVSQSQAEERIKMTLHLPQMQDWLSPAPWVPVLFSPL